MFLLLAGVAGSSGIATVHGVAYEWDTFDPLDNAIITVNSTPEQSMVAKYGVYSFELSNGTYQITARYYQDDELTYYAEDTITVSDEGNYVLDMLLLPSYSNSAGFDVSDTGDISPAGTNRNSLVIGSMIIAIILLFLLIYKMKHNPQLPVKRRSIKDSPISHMASRSDETGTDSSGKVIQKETPEDEEITDEPEEEALSSISGEDKSEPEDGSLSVEAVKSAPEPVIPSDEPVPADLQEILDILESQGGRMTQKDMRKRLRYSEGKVSLMLLDLEKRGKIRKFKKGRGNVLFLVGTEE